MKIFFVIIMLYSLSPLSKSNELLEGFVTPFKIEQTRNLFISGSLLTASMVFINRDFDKHNQAQISKHNFSESFCKLGNNGGQIIPNIAYVVINGILGATTENGTNYQKRAIDMFSATLYASAVTDIIKPIVNEKRPSGGNYSFPSGHATSAFAFASYIAMEHEWYFGVPAYLMAIGVGYSRVASNFHYPHDVVFGATIGMSYGMAQYYKNYLNQITYSPLLLPTNDGKGMQISLSHEF